MKTPYECKASELREGDVVRIASFEGAYNHATVKHVEREKSKQYGASAADIDASPIKCVHLFRPYVHHGSFTYTGGVICYIGTDDFSIWPDNVVTVLEETDIPGLKR